MKAKLLALWLMACAGEGAEAPAEPEPPPPVEVRSAVDRAVATTGDVITYTIEVERDPAVEVQMPEMGAAIAGFRIIDLGTAQAGDADRPEDRHWYKLRADLVGSYVLPAVALRWRPDEDTDWSELATSEIFVEVASVLPADGEATDIRDIKPLRPPEPTVPWAWLVAGGGAAFLLLAATGVWLWRRRAREAPPPPLPHELAFAALDQLRRAELDDLDAVRGWYFDISEVLRAYVEGRYGLNATDLTTDEILGRVGELVGLERDQQSRLEGFLRDTDEVKYAARAPSEDDIERSYENALGFVEHTRTRPGEGA